MIVDRCVMLVAHCWLFVVCGVLLLCVVVIDFVRCRCWLFVVCCA